MHFGNGVVTRCRDVLPSELDGCSDLNTTRFLRRLIDEERPDFVAFTGTCSVCFGRKQFPGKFSPLSMLSPCSSPIHEIIID